MTITETQETRGREGRFDAVLARHELAGLAARSLTTLQVNLGSYCNQACKHCHVDAGPHRDGAGENMDAATAELVVSVLEGGAFESLDLTGGAPELNPNFRPLVLAARSLGLEVIDRCNLSVLFLPGQEGLASFLADQGVHVVASLPYYAKRRADSQRGAGTFDASIEGLRLLNRLGYGMGARPASNGSSTPVRSLELDLVYNPAGAYLPGDQAELEREFKLHLRDEHGIRFDRLLTLTNLPVRRFLDFLRRTGNEAAYRAKLEAAFNPAAAREVMCRDLLSVGPDGRLYDCDFNQMLELGLAGRRRHLRDFDPVLGQRRILTGSHCFGCTAGAGSSCGGAMVEG